MTRLNWKQITDGLDYPEDLVFRATTPDGYTLEACYLEAFGPYARAILPGSKDTGFDSIAFNGAGKNEIIKNGKRKAIQLLKELRARMKEAPP